MYHSVQVESETIVGRELTSRRYGAVGIVNDVVDRGGRLELVVLERTGLCEECLRIHC